MRSIAPFILGWEITDRCNMNCKYCFFSERPRLSGKSGYGSHAAHFWQGKEGQLLDYCGEVAGAQGRSVTLALLGGEPLMAPNLEEICLQARTRGFAITASTNGLLLSHRSVLGIVKEMFDGLIISLDGPREAYTRYRGSSEDWDKVCANIQALTSSPGNLKEILVSVVLHNENLTSFFQLCKELGELGIRKVIVSPIFLAEGHPCFVRLSLSVEASAVFDRLLSERAELLEETGVEVLGSPEFFFRVMDFLKGFPARINCNAGVNNLFCTSDGRCAPCYPYADRGIGFEDLGEPFEIGRKLRGLVHEAGHRWCEHCMDPCVFGKFEYQTRGRIFHDFSARG